MNAASSPADALVLEFIAGARSGEKAEIPSGREYVIGRGSDADIQIDHKKASRRHALIFEKEGRQFIKDLGSINGTIINGEKIAEHELFPGDSIQIADSRIRVRQAGSRPSELRAEDLGGSTVGIFSARDAAGEFATMGNAMSGRLDTTSPRELLNVLIEVRATGVLSIIPSWGAGRALLRDGAIYYARIDGSPEIGPEKALHRLLAAKTGAYDFSNEEPPAVEHEITLSPDSLLKDVEMLPAQFARLDALMPSPDAELSPPEDAADADLNDAETTIVRLALEHRSLSKALDGYPGTDTEAARIIADLLERGALRCRR